MQRMPLNKTRSMPDAPKTSQNENSPALLMARKIRREQGVEQLRAFLSAIGPFISPNELKSICGAFGLNFNTLASDTMHRANHNAAADDSNAFNDTERSGSGNVNPSGNPGMGMNSYPGRENMRTGQYTRGKFNPDRTGNANQNRNFNQRSRTAAGQNSVNQFNGAGNNMNPEANRNSFGRNAGVNLNPGAGMNPAMNMNSGNNMNAGMGANTGANAPFGMNGNPVQMMQTFMQMQNLMNNGADAQKILNFLGSR